MIHEGKNLINLSKMLERFDHDRELVGEVMDVFVAETPERVRRLADAAKQGDMEQLVRLAHSLKGVCGTMHAEPLRELSYQVEMAARAGKAQVASELVPQVLIMLGDLSHYLETAAAGDLPPG
ncbi:Hpt domain-containing protein [Desulfolutivibrio sp.]|uniref:Hpt domain-containing protein n=1 Tax=Desulfolutivibrio sp. TaxID=2773296 RepID=UPI002F962FB8